MLRSFNGQGAYVCDRLSFNILASTHATAAESPVTTTNLRNPVSCMEVHFQACAYPSGMIHISFSFAGVNENAT
jgi:hypothetical protein